MLPSALPTLTINTPLSLAVALRPWEFRSYTMYLPVNDFLTKEKFFVFPDFSPLFF